MLIQSPQATRELCSVTVWQNKASFQSFMKSDAVAALLKSEDFKKVKSWMSDYDMQMMNLVEGWHG